MKLEAYSDATVVLTLPNSVAMADIVWFSVWCRQAAVSTAVLIKLAYIQICTIILIATRPPLEMDIIKFCHPLGSPLNLYCTSRAATDPADPDPDLLTTRIQNYRSGSVKEICTTKISIKF